MKIPLVIALSTAAALYVGCAWLLSTMFTRSADPPSTVILRPAFRVASTIQTLAGVAGLSVLAYWLVFDR